ncbi:MAG: hypothetical protein HY308_16675 [Gammaproteobacteria bacterium]|nr:hypothetical protein [Gammaproteobacteria bacterium]
MQESSLSQAIFQGVWELNSFHGLAFNPNLPALTNDFIFSDSYSGAIAFPSVGNKTRRSNGYDLVKFSTPKAETPNTALETLWQCTKEHYGLTAATAVTGAGGIPIEKIKLGHKAVLGSSEYTNLVSHYGLKFFPQARLPVGSSAAQLAKATFGTIRIFGIVGRALPFVAVGLAVFDAVSIGMCAYEARNGK